MTVFLIHKQENSILSDSTSPQTIYRFTLIPTKIPAISFVEIDKLTLMEMQRPRTVKAI